MTAEALLHHLRLERELISSIGELVKALTFDEFGSVLPEVEQVSERIQSLTESLHELVR